MDDLEKLVTRYEAALREFQQQQAAEMTSVIRSYAKAAPSGDFEMMRKTAALINGMLDRLHLAIRDPVHGRPARLDVVRAFEQIPPRFKLRVAHEHKTIYAGSAYTLDKMALTLMPEPGPTIHSRSQEIGVNF
jgi:hypothetical protein